MSVLITLMNRTSPPMDYNDRKTKAREFLVSTINFYGVAENELKGSWLAGDFHLKWEDDISYSDVDIFLKDVDEENRLRLTGSITQQLTRYFKNSISVSIHSRDSLNRMSLRDAQVLCMAEYIVQYHKILSTSAFPRDYIDAKFSLLVMREELGERYQVVSERIGTLASRLALRVKLGLDTKFPAGAAETMFVKLADEMQTMFFNRCLMNNPDANDAQWVLQELSQCSTIDTWLYQHLKNKINQFVQL